MKTFLLLRPVSYLAVGLFVSALPAAEPRSGTASPEPELRFNFRGAPLEQVLNYLSDAAGLIIVLDTPVSGTVDMWSNQPVSRTEAVSLLNHALNKNGYTATLQGRNLVVSSKENAKRQNIPVRTGNNPQDIPATADMVMQIIPLRNIGAAQAAQDLASLIPESATVTANEDSNSLVVTDTQINVRHVVEVISQLDGSISSDAAMRIFKLNHADATETASLINTLYGTTSNSRNGNNNNAAAGAGNSGGPGAMLAQIMAARSGGGGGGGFPGGFGGASSRSSRSSRGGGSSSSGSRAVVPVSATADPRTGSVIVTGSQSTLHDIADIIAELDHSDAHQQQVYVYTLENANVQQVETVLRNLFQSSNSRATATQSDALSNRAASNSQQTSGSFLNDSSGPR
jgi:general secretion pathway protein D